MSDTRLRLLLDGLLTEFGFAIAEARGLMPKDAPLQKGRAEPFVPTDYAALMPLVDLWHAWDARFDMLGADELAAGHER